MNKTAIKKFAVIAAVAIIANEVWVLSGVRSKAMNAIGKGY